jgi:uncharacterized surface protein with fasciclin (FAS1) repeats
MVLTINVGDEVVWVNDGGNHNVNGNTNSITNESFGNPEDFFVNPTNVENATIYTHTFTIPGTYNYDCSVGNHATNGMTGTINVVPSIFEIVENSETHNTLETAILTAGLNTTLNAEGTYTLFAPTDEAFDAFDEGYLEILLANDALLNQVLLHHVLGSTKMAADIIALDGQSIPTLNEDSLMITVTTDGVMIDNALVTVTNLVANNGVVHVIDAVLLPEQPEVITVMDIIATSPDHTILETALIQSGLNVTLSGDGPFTVFAPDDNAFNSLEDGVLDELLADNDLLTQVLLYHVHGGEALSTDLTNGMLISTVNGSDLTAYVMGNSYMINNANVTSADTETSNGIVHIIDQVLVPNDDDDTSLNNFYELNKEEYLHTINLLGKIVDRNALDKVLIDIYSSGKIIKRFQTAK